MTKVSTILFPSHGNNRFGSAGTQVLNSHEIRRYQHAGGPHGAEYHVLHALVLRVNGVDGILAPSPICFTPRVDVFGLKLRMNTPHVLHAVAGEKALVRTIRTPEELPAFDAIGRMFAQSVLLERAGSGELVRALRTDEDGFVGTVHALEVSFHVTFALEQLIALRTRNRFLQKMLEFFVLIDLLPRRRLVVLAQVTV